MNKIKTSVIEILKSFIYSLGCIISIATTILQIVPSLSEETDKLFSPFFTNSNPFHWGIIAIIFWLATGLFYYFNYRKALQKEINYRPFIKLAEAGITNIFPNINYYGTNSFIAKNLFRTRNLFYLDLVNDPKIKGNNDAKDVSIELTYYKEGEFFPYHKHLARWIGMPEKELGIPHIYCDIPSDGKTKIRWGMGIVDNKCGDIFFLLDAEQTDLSSYGIMVTPPFLPEGKYTVVANVFGKNLWGIEPFVFEISTIKDEAVKLHIKKESKKWQTSNCLDCVTEIAFHPYRLHMKYQCQIPLQRYSQRHRLPVMAGQNCQTFLERPPLRRKPSRRGSNP